jgi:lipoprotein NlpD
MRWPNFANLPFPVARAVAPIVIAALLAACATRQPAPVEDRVATRPPPDAAISAPAPLAPAPAEAESRAKTYTVKRGDTLQQIAMDQGFDYRELAAWNNLENPNVIRVGQVLRLAPPGEAASTTNAAGVTTTPLRPQPSVAEARPTPPITAARPGENVKSTPKALKEPYSEQAVREITQFGAAQAVPPPATAPPAENVAAAPRGEAKTEPARSATTEPSNDDRLDWAWPAKGKLVGTYSETANLKGIDIAGKAGEPVLASATGKVVYAGTGLRGYGKLIIIKHNNTFLSAYAHNREILVKEGQQVTKGQKIAEMGNSDADQVKLHFEIRRLGKPMDPARYLPPA